MQTQQQSQAPGFTAKVNNANQSAICFASKDAVKRVSIEFLLKQRLQIPIFQRRYCWEQEQWRTLLSDATLVVDGQKSVHSLGRITCAIRESSESHNKTLLVIDGQQRNTTGLLLLAAIRDTVSSRHPNTTLASEVENKINRALFPDQKGLEAWLKNAARRKSDNAIVIEEGEGLDFAALVPTFFDRSSFFVAISPPQANAVSPEGVWNRPQEAKQYFQQRLSERPTEKITCLVDVVLHKLEWLFFPIRLSGQDDGTEDLQVVFERLAIRDAMFCRPHRQTEYANMGAADFVRNLLLGSFADEDKAIAMYKKHWLPIERAAATSAAQHNHDIADALKNMFECFLGEQSPQDRSDDKAPPNPMHQFVGGSLYPKFRSWLAGVMSAHPATNPEDQVTKQLAKLCKFAKVYFQDPSRFRAFARPQTPRRRTSKRSQTGSNTGKPNPLSSNRSF